MIEFRFKVTGNLISAQLASQDATSFSSVANPTLDNYEKDSFLRLSWQPRTVVYITVRESDIYHSPNIDPFSRYFSFSLLLFSNSGAVTRIAIMPIPYSIHTP